MLLPYLEGFLYSCVYLLWMNFGYFGVKSLSFLYMFTTSRMHIGAHEWVPLP